MALDRYWIDRAGRPARNCAKANQRECEAARISKDFLLAAEIAEAPDVGDV
jgi:hypothetical protein